MPMRNNIRRLLRPGRTNFFSCRSVKAVKKTLATRKRRKAPVSGPTCWARFFPAMNVPPQQVVSLVSFQI